MQTRAAGEREAGELKPEREQVVQGAGSWPKPTAVPGVDRDDAADPAPMGRLQGVRTRSNPPMVSGTAARPRLRAKSMAAARPWAPASLAIAAGSARCARPTRESRYTSAKRFPEWTMATPTPTLAPYVAAMIRMPVRALRSAHHGGIPYPPCEPASWSRNRSFRTQTFVAKNSRIMEAWSSAVTSDQRVAIGTAGGPHHLLLRMRVGVGRTSVAGVPLVGRPHPIALPVTSASETE
jgi:hypothetical protein